MKHKLRIEKGRHSQLWYVECSCGWSPPFKSPTTGRWGRPTQEAALAVGIDHQMEAPDRCYPCTELRTTGGCLCPVSTS